jgi:hypothetical protein
VVANLDGRLASRHFRNQLYLLGRPSRGEEPQLNEYISFAQAWTPEIEIVELDAGGQLNLYYREPARRSEKEIFWAGDGIQVWLQLLLHIFRLRGVDVLVLDEPDVFLHADLQRRLVRLLETLECQVITATHSPEMLSEAQPSSVVWVDKAARKAIRAPKESVLADLSGALGTQFNLRLAKALRSRLVLFVEGDDLKLLRNVARTLGLDRLAREIGIAEVQLEGFTNWEHVEPFQWLISALLNSAIPVYVLLDRDYRSDEAAAAVCARLASIGVSSHVWGRKELESYLLVDEALARNSRVELDWIRTQMDQICDGLREFTFARILDELLRERVTSKRHRVDVTQAVTKDFNRDWNNRDWRIGRCPPKEMLRQLNMILEMERKSTVSFRKLSTTLRMDEIPREMATTLRTIEEIVS